MDGFITRKRTTSNSDDSASTVGSSDSMKQRSLRFYETVQIALLPWQEREEARKARSGQWKPAPFSDELWEGDSMTFREVELSSEEFKQLSNANKRKKSPMPLRAFARMFSLANTVQEATEEGRLAGVDIIHARARVFAEDFDEDERDSLGRLGSTESSEASRIVMKLSTELIEEDGLVMKFDVDWDATQSRPPPPKPPMANRPSGDKTTRFIASPPPGPSPSELAGFIPMLEAEISYPNDPRKKSSNLPYQTGPLFICGEGKRPIFYLADEPLKDDNAWVEPLIEPTKKPNKKKSIIGAVFSTLFPVAVV